ENAQGETMKTKSKMLFGGALLSAGMATHSSAQQFLLSGTQSIGGYDTVVEIFGYDDYSIGPFEVRSVDGGIGDSVSYSFVNAEGISSISATQFSVDAFSNGYLGYLENLTARARGAVTVDQNATLEIAWDYSNAGFQASGRVSIFDESAGNLVFSTPLGVNAGSALVPVFAGTNYRISLQTQVGSSAPPDTGVGPPPYSSFATVTLIPAPASVALMGLAGLAAVRRRR
ncbi:MAG: PEP-CTERM sorting domain-containing protein, partial [Planctomycetota bacterium]